MIDAANVTDEALQSFDQMMIEVALKVDRFSPLAVEIWAEVLRELDVRGMVRLVRGTYEDVGNSLVERLYKP
jgi:hypothetical protein